MSSFNVIDVPMRGSSSYSLVRSVNDNGVVIGEFKYDSRLASKPGFRRYVCNGKKQTSRCLRSMHVHWESKKFDSDPAQFNHHTDCQYSAGVAAPAAGVAAPVAAAPAAGVAAPAAAAAAAAAAPAAGVAAPAAAAPATAVDDGAAAPRVPAAAGVIAQAAAGVDPAQALPDKIFFRNLGRSIGEAVRANAGDIGGRGGALLSRGLGRLRSQSPINDRQRNNAEQNARLDLEIKQATLEWVRTQTEYARFLMRRPH